MKMNNRKHLKAKT